MPKDLILGTLKKRLEPLNISKLIVEIEIATEIYKIHLQTKDAKSDSFRLSESDITTIKRIFLRKIVKDYEIKNENKVKAAIIQIDLSKEKPDFEIFIKEPDDKIYKYEY